jgi:hypothetical protein
VQLRDTGNALEFFEHEKLAGTYVYQDPFKPYLHPLNTPSGWTVSLRSPHDHKHHKGLMYALRTSDVNFWEEVATVPGEAVGVQEHQSFLSLVEVGDEVGFVEKLLWRSKADDATLFEEQRELTCRLDLERPAYEWTWKTTLTVAQDMELIMSQWSYISPEGNHVNYHGLGLRFRREFGCTGGNLLIVDGKELDFQRGMGLTPQEVTFAGSIDGTWPVARSAVAISQSQSGGLFVMEAPFAFVGLGPSNLRPLELEKGQTIAETYKIRVFDYEP